ncbi:smF [Trichonephila clavipes]|nr:smF [Trichonephila clavipes]
MSATVCGSFVNPMPFLRSLVGKWVNVKQKKGYEIRGRLVSCDCYINLQAYSMGSISSGLLELQHRLDFILVVVLNQKSSSKLKLSISGLK